MVLKQFALLNILKKQTEFNATIEDALDFQVIEFNKDARKIVVSHIRTHEEYEGTSTKAPKKSSSSKSNLKSINNNAEKSTLGDLDALAELKEKMDKKK